MKTSRLHLLIDRGPRNPLVILFLVSLFIFTVIGIFSRKGIFSLWAFGDAQMLNAGINFTNQGFWANHFLPLINPGLPHSLIENNGPNGRYFHYPSLHAIAIGLLFRAINTISNINEIDPNVLKCMAQILFSLISLSAIYLFSEFVRKETNRFYSFLTAVLISISGWYFKFGYSLCDQVFAYLFWAFDLYLLQTVFSKKEIGNFSKIIFFGMIGFFATRNSIETPIHLFFLNSLCYFYFKYKKNMTKMKVSMLTSYITGVLLASLIQIIQIYLEFRNIDAMFNHLNVITSKKSNISDIGNLDIYLESINRWNIKYAICTIVISFVSFRFFHFNKYGKENSSGIILCMNSFSIFLLFLILPKQINDMSSYANYYLFTSAVLISTVYIYRKQLQSKHVLISLGIKVMSLALLFSIVISINMKRNFSSVFEDEASKWGPQQSWSEIQKINYGDFQKIRLATKPNDVLFVPDEFIGNTKNEINSVMEFYISRHLLPYSSLKDCKSTLFKIHGSTRVGIIRWKNLNNHRDGLIFSGFVSEKLCNNGKYEKTR